MPAIIVSSILICCHALFLKNFQVIFVSGCHALVNFFVDSILQCNGSESFSSQYWIWKVNFRLKIFANQLKILKWRPFSSAADLQLEPTIILKNDRTYFKNLEHRKICMYVLSMFGQFSTLCMKIIYYYYDLYFKLVQTS